MRGASFFLVGCSPDDLSDLITEDKVEHRIDISNDERLDRVNENLILIQKKNGLTFGTDAYLLAAFIKPNIKGKAAELGCGTGIISLLLASRQRFSRIFAFEFQESFFELTSRNVSLNGFDNTIIPVCADVREVSFATTGGEVDTVFANPPYMKADSGKRNLHDEKFIARHEVMGGIYDFCACAARLLKFGGRFFVVWRPDRLSELMDALHINKLEPKIMTFVHSDTESPPSMVLVSANKGGASSLRITPPLFLYASPDSREMSEQAVYIYENMSFGQKKSDKQ